ncbi:MAG TPA: phosphopantetheine-binding protein [Bacteroidia bacterium]|jgi:methoxymalonate biosynthesis acyl carrier protein|nr:phosphopantetheine-binding protein [Bacteroidia bacterium]
MQFSVEKIEQLISEKIFELTYKKVSSTNEELVDSGVLNSVTIVELVVELEKELAVSISFVEVTKENFKTINAIKTLLLKK